MTPTEYKSAAKTLNLTRQKLGEWLGVSRRTEVTYGQTGPSGPARRAILMALKHGVEE